MDIKNTSGEVLHTVEGDSLAQIDLMRQQLAGADFRNADLTRTRMYQCNLKGANFAGATLRWTNFQIADLTGANLQDTDLANASLIDTILCGADLSTAQNLEWAIIKGAKYDAQTKFPKGFDPKLENMILLTASPA